MIEAIYQHLMVLCSDLIAPFYYVVSSDKRIFWLYLCTGFLLLYLVRKPRKIGFFGLVQKSLATKYWFNSSTKIDYAWVIINQVGKALLITPLLISQLALALFIYRYGVEHFGEGDIFHWPKWQVMTAFTVALFVVDDFSRFFIHFLYHKVPWLWRFHAIHHSARVMTPLTLYRIHFVEYLLNSCRSVLVTGLISGLFMYVFAGQISLLEVLGVNVFTLVFNVMGANLRHCHIRLGFGVFEHVFISPTQHQIHHSNAKRHLDKNFGAALAIWDKIFGSWLGSKNQHVTRFGLYKQAAPQKISEQIWGISR